MGKKTANKIQIVDENQDIKNEICKLLEEGVWFKDACVLAGASEPTGHRWRKEDESFKSQVKASILKYKRSLIKTVNFNSMKDGKVGLEVLRTRWPREWNIAKKIEHGGSIKHTVTARKTDIKGFAADLLAIAHDGSGHDSGGSDTSGNLPGLQEKPGKS